MVYLTSDEYLDRFGDVETIRLTDTDKTGTVDTAKVDTAIEDAGQFADSYLAARYTLPIDGDTPEILKGIIAALARERLHKNRAPDAVTAEADRARSQLKDLAAGRATLMLGGSTDATPEEIATGEAVASGDGLPRVFTPERMADYTSLAGYPYWRNGPLG